MNKWWVSISPPAVDSRKGAFSDRFHRVIAITDDISCGVSSATGQLQVLAQWHSSCVCLPQTEYYTVQIVSTCPGLFGCYFANQIPALWYLGLENKVFGLQWIWRLLGNGSEWYLRVFSTSVEKPSGSLEWVSDSQRMRSTIFATKLGKKKKKSLQFRKEENSGPSATSNLETSHCIVLFVFLIMTFCQFLKELFIWMHFLASFFHSFFPEHSQFLFVEREDWHLPKATTK